MNSEEIIKNTIKELNNFDKILKIELKEGKSKDIIPASNDDGFIHATEISIFKKGKRIYTQSYFSDTYNTYREMAFDRILQMIVLSGLVNHK